VLIAHRWGHPCPAIHYTWEPGVEVIWRKRARQVPLSRWPVRREPNLVRKHVLCVADDSDPAPAVLSFVHGLERVAVSGNEIAFDDAPGLPELHLAVRGVVDRVVLAIRDMLVGYRVLDDRSLT